MVDQQIHSKFRKLIAEAFNYEDAMMENNITQDDVDNLRELSISSEFVPRGIVDKILLLILIACDNAMDKSVNLLHNYCKFKKRAPEFFANRDVESKEIQSAFENQYYFPLPPTPKNCNLFFHKLSNYEPRNYVFDNAEKAFLVTIGKVLNWFY